MRLIRHMAIFAAAAAAMLLVLDVYLRAAEIQTPMETRIDHEIGPTYMPDMNVTRFNEGFHIGRTNEYGFYGESRPPRREGDELRILLLGDSYVVGNTVFERHHFKTRLEHDLSTALGRDVAVLNFGKADFALPNVYAYYRNFASKWDHDLALVFADRNDLLISFQRDRGLYPACELVDGRIEISNGFRDSRLYRTYSRVEPLSRNSSLFRLAYNARKVAADGKLPAMVLDKLHPLLFESDDGTWKRAPEGEMRPLVHAVLDELAADGRVVMVLKESMDPELEHAVASHGLDVLELGPALDALGASGVDPYVWQVTGRYGHWNHEAHQAIGTALARELAPRFGP